MLWALWVTSCPGPLCSSIAIQDEAQRFGWLCSWKDWWGRGGFSRGMMRAGPREDVDTVWGLAREGLGPLLPRKKEH